MPSGRPTIGDQHDQRALVRIPDPLELQRVRGSCQAFRKWGSAAVLQFREALGRGVHRAGRRQGQIGLGTPKGDQPDTVSALVCVQ